MKKTLLIALLSISVNAFAQPVILNSNNLPLPGLTAPVSSAIAAGLGSAGANQTWDFSSLTYASLGNATIIMPSSSPIGASFPTADLAYSFSSSYSFFNVTSAQMEVMAYTITTPGSGNDYSPNPRTILKFPFNYLDTISDSWQKTGGPVDSVLLTYDGYGTLITPTATYTNVVRIKEDYGSGGIDYQWYSLNPLFSVMIYDHNANTLYHTSAVPTGISGAANSNPTIDVFPNPANTMLTVRFPEEDFSSGIKLSLINSLGQTIQQVSVEALVSNIQLEKITPGIYFYSLKVENGTLKKTGKIRIE